MCCLRYGIILTVLIIGSKISETTASIFRNTVVTRGETLTLSCTHPELNHDSTGIIFWRRIRSGSNKLELLYNGYSTMNDADRLQFSTERANASEGLIGHHHRMTISPVRISDAGRYFCIQPTTNVGMQTAELVVLESHASCDYSVKSLDSSYVSVFLCELTYSGSWAPEIVWLGKEKSSSQLSLIRINQTDVLKNFKLSSSINLTTTQLNNYDQIHCKVSFNEKGSPQIDESSVTDVPSYNKTTICPYAVVQEHPSSTTEKDTSISVQSNVEMVKVSTLKRPMDVIPKNKPFVEIRTTQRPPESSASSTEVEGIPNWVTIVAASVVGAIVLLANIVIFSIIFIRQKRSQRNNAKSNSLEDFSELPSHKRNASVMRGRHQSQSPEHVQDNAYEPIPGIGNTYTALITDNRSFDSSNYAHYCSISDSTDSDDKADLPGPPLISGQNDYLTMPDIRKSCEHEEKTRPELLPGQNDYLTMPDTRKSSVNEEETGFINNEIKKQDPESNTDYET